MPGQADPTVVKEVGKSVGSNPRLDTYLGRRHEITGEGEWLLNFSRALDYNLDGFMRREPIDHQSFRTIEVVSLLPINGAII